MVEQTNFIEEIFHSIDIISNVNAIEEISSASLSKRDIINLCGGIPSKNVIYLTLDVQSSATHVLDVNISTNLYDIDRTINFNSKVIFNNFMRVQEQRTGTGRNLLINQVIAAKNKGVTLLNTNATAKPNEYNGYITWGKLGYTMSFTSKEQFRKLLKDYNKNELTLFDLLKTKEGYDFWEEYGFSWNGNFFLSDGSENIRLLKEYLKSKNINVQSL